MLSLFSSLLTLTVAGLGLITVYLLVLTAAAFLGRTVRPPASPARRRFAMLIPAYNEETLIGRLLENLGRLDYPRSRFDIYVVADNCDDRTAALARSLGARVYERFDHVAQGKGFALRWLLQRIR